MAHVIAQEDKQGVFGVDSGDVAQARFADMRDGA